VCFRLSSRARRRHLIRSNFKLSHRRRAKRSQERNIGGGAASGHENSSDARAIVAGVEGQPFSVKVGFEPGAEIHG
jgi:hypothetical protein